MANDINFKRFIEKDWLEYFLSIARLIRKVIEKINKENQTRMLRMYSKSPFQYEKYIYYLDIYCQGTFMENNKDYLISNYLKNYPVEINKKCIFSLNIFFFN